MNKTLTLIGLTIISFSSCSKDDNLINDVGRRDPSPSDYMRYSGSDYSQHIPIDSGDRMIASYLLSINYPSVATELRSIVFNADSMRSYLSNGSIATLKFSLAHKLSFINSGNYGEEAGTSEAALTFVMSGLDEEDDDYIYAPGNEVYDLRGSARLCLDTANRMVESYLSSIDYVNNNVDLRSMTFDADTMRGFLSNSNVVNLKFMLAHRDGYIHSGLYGEHCGTSSYGLTFIIVGLNSSDQVVYTANNMVMEHTRPCPSFCTNSALFTQ